MKVISHGKKLPPTERLECSLCKCKFEIQINDLFDISYTAHGKIGYVKCPDCNANLKIREEKCINPIFKLWFSVEDLIPKHIL